MPCFIRAMRRLRIPVPTDEEFAEWFEGEIIRSLKVKDHEELERALETLLRTDPERLRKLMEYLLHRYRERQREKEIMAKLRTSSPKRRKRRRVEREEYVV